MTRKNDLKKVSPVILKQARVPYSSRITSVAKMERQGNSQIQALNSHIKQYTAKEEIAREGSPPSCRHFPYKREKMRKSYFQK